jgi:hypothetical protein
MRQTKSSKFILALIMLAAVFLLSGCRTTLLVHNATVKQITPIFKDYVGMQGYMISYQNDQTGSYHVDMGSVFVAGTTSGSSTRSIIAVKPSESQPMTAYEETSWNSTNIPEHYTQATAAISIIQEGSDVLLNIDTNDAGGASLNDIRDYIKSLGYTVENK